MARNRNRRAGANPATEVLDTEALDELEDLAEDLTDDEDVEEVEEDEEVESFVTPTALAQELGVDPKQLRAFLRKAFPRNPSEKNTSWRLTEAHVKAATERFADDEDDEDDSDED